MANWTIALIVFVSLWAYTFMGHFFFRLITKDVEEYEIDRDAPIYYGGAIIWPVTLLIHLFFIWPPKIVKKIENWYFNKEKSVTISSNKL